MLTGTAGVAMASFAGMTIQALAALLTIGPVTQAATRPPLVVAVLEEPQCHDDVGPAVRALFAKRGTAWVSMDSRDSAGPTLPERWTVAFDGRSLGSLRTVDPGFVIAYPWTYPRDRLLQVAAAPALPFVPNGRELFAGWCSIPARRPLVLVSQPRYEDPERWKRSEPPPGLRPRLFPEFKAHVGDVVVCAPEASEPVPLALRPEHLEPFAAYKDQGGRHLVAVRLAPGRNTCDDFQEAAWAPNWFLVGATVRYLGSHLELVDAGDYDGDGHSEVLFWYSAHNNDGYALFYDDFRKHVDFRWS